MKAVSLAHELFHELLLSFETFNPCMGNNLWMRFVKQFEFSEPIYLTDKLIDWIDYFGILTEFCEVLDHLRTAHELLH